MLVNVEGVFRFSLQILSQAFQILRRTEQNMTPNVYRSASRVTVVLDRI